jgi:hypothetical protein
MKMPLSITTYWLYHVLVIALCASTVGALTFIACPRVEAGSLLDVEISSEPPADEAEDADFPPGGNPIDFFDAYSWKLFIALNWPAESNKRGVPDKTKDISDITAPRVWETWKSMSEIFQPAGAEPAAWDSPDMTACEADALNRAGPPVRRLPFAKLGSVLEDFNQVDATGFAVGPVVARNRTYLRYEIRVNQKQFDAIRTGKLYRRETLEKKAKDKERIVFPDQAIEVKAAWRELKPSEDAAQRARYYRLQARAVEPETGRCQTKEFALIGFHIGQKTANRRQWTWSTFEHVDALAASTEPGLDLPPWLALAPDDAHASPPGDPITNQNGPKPDPDPTLVRRFTPNPDITGVSRPRTDATNKKWQENSKIKNTVWKNYRLVLTQWPTQLKQETSLGRPFPSSNVANVTMETYRNLQVSSCIQCHLQAGITSADSGDSFATDFAWFLGLRAFPVPSSSAGLTPGGNEPGAARSRAFRTRLRQAAEKALQRDPEPEFKK